MTRWLWMFLVLAASVPVAGSEDARKPATTERRFDPTELYVSQRLEGWPILVHPLLLNDESATGERTLKLLGQQLDQIQRRLPEEAVKKLQTVRIWVEFDEPHHPCMAYHPSPGWLVNNDMNPDKARCVEIADARNFLDWTIAQPWMVLHELAHAYHHQFLDGGFENPAITQLHVRHSTADAYRSVVHIHGRRGKHYAATNPMEYFAEATEAYFGTNDFYPFVRVELAEHDPELFDLLGELWNASPRDRRRPEKLGESSTAE